MILTITANPTIDRVYFLDNFEHGKIHRPANMSCSAGGKGINVARVLKILGTDVAAMGFLGGYSGQYISSEIKKLGIIDNFTQIKGETRTCVNISTTTNQSCEILEPGPEITPKDITNFIETFKKYICKCSLVIISGSMSRDMPLDFYNTLIKIAKDANKKTILDTSGDALKLGIEAQPFMVKPNKAELSTYLGKEINNIADIKTALKELKSLGIELPVLSLGKEGAAAYVENEFYCFTTPDIPIINAVGSGDSLVAGIAFGINHGYNYLDSITLGMSCGIANTQFVQTGIISKDLIDLYYKQVKIGANND